jgi:pseudoazurin|tara:strand:- start:137 stop:562 length:426 start_codon:yes stop_codon:yes gene_type:complete
MRYFLILIITLWTGLSYAEDTEIEMLNKFNNEYMVYSKKIVKINVGDTVFWKSTDPSHNVEFIKGAVPEGVKTFKSKLSKDVSYEFKIPGIYAYWCTPHKSLGMIGFVIVGNDLSNKEAISNVRYFGKSKKIAEELIEQLI